MSTVLTPSLRFAAQGVKLDLPRGSEAYRMLDKAQHVEGFQHSYPAEAVRLATEALISIGANEEVTPIGVRLLFAMMEAL